MFEVTTLGQVCSLHSYPQGETMLTRLLAPGGGQDYNGSEQRR